MEEALRSVGALGAGIATAAGGSARFASRLSELVTGSPEDAALGVMHYMQASSTTVRAIAARGGVDAIREEFEAFVQSARERLAAAASAEQQLPWWATVEVAEEALECVRYCLDEEAGSSPKTFANSPHPRDCDENGTLAARTLHGRGMRLADFCELPEARTARLDASQIAALRIYTTDAFKVLVAPLRAGEVHPCPVTVTNLTDAIGKLRAVSARESTAVVDLWRGMKEVGVSEGFMQHGGSELAPMSTTTDLGVALQYAGAAGATNGALLFKLRTDSFMGRGASIAFLSAFPAEAEVTL